MSDHAALRAHRHKWKYDRSRFSRRCACGVVQIRRLTTKEQQEAERTMKRDQDRR